MDKHLFSIIDSLGGNHSLSLLDYECLISHRSDEGAMLLAEKASSVRDSLYGSDIFIRGLIEFSNICKNNCLYCGIRKGNHNCNRYRLKETEIMSCCKTGYNLGFRTFVLQSGEDPYFTDERLARIVEKIKTEYPDCAITLSSGERTKESYKRLFDAGAERYLLRHEAASKELFNKLHPKEQLYENRMECAWNLKDIGYSVGLGFMVSPPFQTEKDLALDLKFIEEFHPDMCGIGPFIPHVNTEFKNYPSGTVELTCYLLSIIRLIVPEILLPATTALGTIDPSGREKGIAAGANVIMPNLSPEETKKKYELYNGKLCTGSESAENIKELDKRMRKIGHKIVIDRGDVRRLPYGNTK